MDFIKNYQFKKGSDDLGTVFYQNMVTGNDELLVSAMTMDGQDNILFKTDHLGRVLWALSLEAYYVCSMILCHNGDALALLSVFGSNVPVVIRVGSQGQILWRRVISFSMVDTVNAKPLVVETPEGYGVVCLEQSYYEEKLLIKLDPSGQVVKSTSFKDPYLALGEMHYDPVLRHIIWVSKMIDHQLGPNASIVVFTESLEVVKKRRLKLSPNDFNSDNYTGDIFSIVTANDYKLVVSSDFHFYAPLSKDLPIGSISVHKTLHNNRYAYQQNHLSPNYFYRYKNSQVDFIDFDKGILKKVALGANGFNEIIVPYHVSNGHLYYSFNHTIYATSEDFQECIDLVVNSTEPLDLTPTTITIEDLVLEVKEPFIQFSNDNLETFTGLTWQEEPICVPTNPQFPQSPHLYLQAAGSTGADGSARGIHLRWMLKKQLTHHLPKGNLANTTHHLNKPDDFVKIYRAAYAPKVTSLDLSTPPQTVDDLNQKWMYSVDEQFISVHFHQADRYQTIRSSINPLVNPQGFIQNYGDGLMEVSTEKNVFFAVRWVVNQGQAGSQLQVECFGVEENTLASPKSIIARQTFDQNMLSAAQVNLENGRSVRWRAKQCGVVALELELYDELLDDLNQNQAWKALGKFALSTDDATAFQGLEPTPGLVHGQWPRYNDQTFVNTANYHDKWSGTREAPDRNIKEVVQKYLTLSDQANNPKAMEMVQFTTDEGITDQMEISNLDMLQLASFDYHVARMLGLGYLDTDPAVMSGKFVYKLEYTTTADLGDGEGARTVTHTYLSLPTAIDDERLPYAVDLEAPQMGTQYNESAENQVKITDEQGYTQDGKTRFISLFAQALPEHDEGGFFAASDSFNFAQSTYPVYTGIEYKAQGGSWQRPELLNNVRHLAAVPTGVTPYAESVVLHLPDPGEALYVHREKKAGTHVYSSYGVNWFGRATRSSIAHSVTTNFPLKNNLLPPSGLQAVLVQPESPLLFTSQNDQQRLRQITNADKTLVRLHFQYHGFQELVRYKIIPEDMGNATDALHPNAIFPDAEELFADAIEIFFRSSAPQQLLGKAQHIQPDPQDALVAVVSTETYRVVSNGSEWVPTVAAHQADNFAGGVLVLEDKQYLIKEVIPNASTGSGPAIKIYKQEMTGGVDSNLPLNAALPTLKADGKFMAVENMQGNQAWGTTNPYGFKVQIGAQWAVHREVIQQPESSNVNTEFVEKSRGIWGQATIAATGQVGEYKISFTDGTQLANHPQFKPQGNSVNWYQGIVRIHEAAKPLGKRKNLQVVKIEGIGQAGLVLYVVDAERRQTGATQDIIQTGTQVSVNFYPGYQVHLYADSAWGLTESNVLPKVGEGVHYSIFGARSLATSKAMTSNISTPQLMFAQEVVQPKRPELPQGSLYATRPDVLGKAHYTLVTRFGHSPHAVLYYRMDEQALLNALYRPDTIKAIRTALEGLQDTAYVTNRWRNVLTFDYNYPADDPVNENGKFGVYPPTASGHRLPNPDRPPLFNGAEVPGQIKDRIRQAVLNAFVPLTEIPLLYQHIKGESYQPSPKPQVIRGKNGQLLLPEHPDFDIAPMAKKIGTHQVLFTDFGLDGTSNNVYFYAVREMGSTMQLGEFSPILGPVTLVNTQAPEAPQVKSVMPVLANEVAQGAPGMQFEINAYSSLQNIKRVNVYRTMEPTNSLSVRFMDLVKTVELGDQQAQKSIWVVKDDFAEVDFIPYGEPMYYRLTVDRAVTYADKQGNIVQGNVASLPSKLLISSMVDARTPSTPSLALEATPVNPQFELTNVRLSWTKTTHNGKYHLYKMNKQGSWEKVYELVSSDASLVVGLVDTALQSDRLLLKNTEGTNIYHHFKVVAENSSGLWSNEEKILTIAEG
ncbi:hypothetical protein [Microscilla marina]|uniref:Uncharacterized protein n=1 Tax=Microscilla marina ATCC 23134 TaxID=313606 RepID=A1ZZL1_MICM2|nr:hypothetical protein [Microscilla marina]EAY24165.1 hypothetical protein M23134_00896 [Microscilla marina ATCC 23134]